MTTKIVGLIRNKINATLGNVRTSIGEEFRLALIAKLFEECGEVVAGQTDPKEYADIVDVLMALAELNGVAWQDVALAQMAKAEAQGIYDKNHIWMAK